MENRHIVSSEDKHYSIVAALHEADRDHLCQIFTDYLPSYVVCPVDSVEQLGALLRDNPPKSVVVSADMCDDLLTPKSLTEAIRHYCDTAHILWVIPADADHTFWLESAKKHNFDILVQPVHGIELAQRCLCADSDGNQLNLINKKLNKLLQKRSKSLYESDERYRLLFNSCSDGVMIVRSRPGGKLYDIAEVNNQLCKLLGYPKAEFLALQPKDIVEPKRIGYVNARMESIRAYRHVVFETVLLSRDGRQIAVGATARLFTFKERPYVIFLIHVPDSSDTQSPPGVSARVYHALAEQTGQIIYEYNITKNRLRIDGATQQITGYTNDQLRAATRSTLLHIIHDEDRRKVISRFADAIKHLGPYESNYRIRHASGEIRHIEDAGIVLLGRSGKASRFLGSVKDVTKRIKTEQDNMRAAQNLQHSKRLESLGVLAGGIAHDFNNILAAIIGMTDMSIQALEGANPEVLLDLKESLGAAHRAKDLVKQILAFSRQSGEEHKPLYLHVVVREVLGLIRASMPSNIRVIDRVDEQSGMTMANATQMHQVLMNYCTNSMQAMSARGGELEVRLENFEVTPRFAAVNPKLQAGPYVKLTVSDRGHGMDDNVVRRIFDPFFTTKGPGEGSGMGLAMVYGIVANHGGAILVESALGQGTHVHTYFPRVESILAREHNHRTEARRGTERVLVIDDEQVVRRYFDRALSQLGYRVQTENYPREAIATIKADPEAFDIVITDYQMPEMTGVSLARSIHRIRPEIPIVLFTGFSQNVDLEEATEAGIFEIVPKPVIVSQLAETLRRALDGASSRTPIKELSRE